MKKLIVSTAVIGLLSIGSIAFAQSTVTGTLSSGSSGSSGSGTTVTGTVGSGNSLTGTVTAPSTSSGGGGGGASNGPPAGGGGGGGPDTTVICPNLPNSLYTLPSGYDIVDGNCDPAGAVLGASTGPTTDTTVPGIPNTGAGGNAEENDLVLLASGLLGTFASIALFRRYFVRQ